MREEEVLDELLRDGARALFDLPRLQVDEGRAQDAFKVKAVMAVETLVLDGDYRLLHGVGDVSELDVIGVVLVDAAVYGALQEDDARKALG